MSPSQRYTVAVSTGGLSSRANALAEVNPALVRALRIMVPRLSMASTVATGAIADKMAPCGLSRT